MSVDKEGGAARVAMKPLEALRCAQSGCRCECFKPGKVTTRICDSCRHGWVLHALDKLSYKTAGGGSVEVVQCNIVFDIASLMLYGAQAVPVRLKVLLDRLFSVLQHDDVIQVLHTFGWSYDDYARGYILQDSGGVLDKWSVMSRDEEQLVLQQFLRFGETRAIARDMVLQDSHDRHCVTLTSGISSSSSSSVMAGQSDIKKFIERSSSSSSNAAPSLSGSSVAAGDAVLASPVAAAAAAASLLRAYDLRHFLSRTTPLPYSAAAAAMVTGRLLGPTPGHVFSASPLLPITTGGVVSRPSQPFDYSPPGQAAPTGTPNKLGVGGANTCLHGNQYHSSIPRAVPLQSSASLSSPSDSRVDTISTPEGVLDFSRKTSQSQRDDDVISRPSSAASLLSPSSSPGAMDGDSSSRDLLQGRKTLSHALKRPWQPTPGYGGTLVGPSGKKRVLCTACQKTFCDKGALKIHYSAVHLKEMHRCTVLGCTMTFSSRRSRNRHSANPNPKLHSAAVRRKLPDGAVLLDDRQPLGESVSGQALSPADDNDDDILSPEHSEDDSMDLMPMSGVCTIMPPSLVYESDDDTPGDSDASDTDDVTPVTHLSPINDDVAALHTAYDGNLFPANLSSAANSSKSSRRKRLQPTKCLSTGSVDASNNNLDIDMSAATPVMTNVKAAHKTQCSAHLTPTGVSVDNQGLDLSSNSASVTGDNKFSITDDDVVLNLSTSKSALEVDAMVTTACVKSLEYPGFHGDVKIEIDMNGEGGEQEDNSAPGDVCAGGDAVMVHSVCGEAFSSAADAVAVVLASASRCDATPATDKHVTDDADQSEQGDGSSRVAGETRSSLIDSRRAGLSTRHVHKLHVASTVKANGVVY